MHKIEDITRRVKAGQIEDIKAIAQTMKLDDCIKIAVQEMTKTLQNPAEVKALLLGLAMFAKEAPNATKMLTDPNALKELKSIFSFSFSLSGAIDFARLLPKVLTLSKRYNLLEDFKD